VRYDDPATLHRNQGVTAAAADKLVITLYTAEADIDGRDG
jgi:hypothetical protein